MTPLALAAALPSLSLTCPTGISWAYLPNKLHVPKFLSQHLPLREPKVSQGTWWSKQEMNGCQGYAFIVQLVCASQLTTLNWLVCQKLTGKQGTQGNKWRPHAHKGFCLDRAPLGNRRSHPFHDPNPHTVPTSVWGWSPDLTRPLVPSAGAWRDNASLSLTLCLWRGVCSAPARKCRRVPLSPGSSSPSRRQPTVYSVTPIIFSTCSVLLPFLVITEKRNGQCCIGVAQRIMIEGWGRSPLLFLSCSLLFSPLPFPQPTTRFLSPVHASVL